jgi:hypothetical protein
MAATFSIPKYTTKGTPWEDIDPKILYEYFGEFFFSRKVTAAYEYAASCKSWEKMDRGRVESKSEPKRDILSTRWQRVTDMCTSGRRAAACRF